MFTSIDRDTEEKKAGRNAFAIAPIRCKVVQHSGSDDDGKKRKRKKTDEANDRIKSFGEFPTGCLRNSRKTGASEESFSRVDREGCCRKIRG